MTEMDNRKLGLDLPDLVDLEPWDEARNAAAERDDLERWLNLVPKIPSLRPYQKQFAALDDYFVQVELEGEDLYLWRAYKEVIMQRQTGVYEDILPLTDIILQDLFYFFTRHELLAGVKSRYSKRVVPLTFLGRSEDYYYTYAGDHELPVVVVSIPQSRIQSVWNWLAIPHEVGHHVLSHFPGYDDELFGRVAQVLQDLDLEVLRGCYQGSMSNKELVGHIWYFWLEEVVADIYGILYTGPAQVMARQEDACQLFGQGLPVEATYLDARPEGVSRYPTCYVRCLFQTQLLRYLGFSSWADELEARWVRRWGKHDNLHWYDESRGLASGAPPLISIPVSEMIRAFTAMIEPIVATPHESFGGHRLMDLISYDEDDHERVLRISGGLLDDVRGYSRKDRARHILAASRMAYEQRPDLQESIHDTAVAAIRNCSQWLK